MLIGQVFKLNLDKYGTLSDLYQTAGLIWFK